MIHFSPPSLFICTHDTFSLLLSILGVDFNLEQPRLDFTGYGSLIDHLGGKLSGFGEAAAIPYASYQTIFDQKGERSMQKFMNTSQNFWKLGFPQFWRDLFFKLRDTSVKI